MSMDTLGGADVTRKCGEGSRPGRNHVDTSCGFLVQVLTLSCGGSESQRIHLKSLV